MYMERDTLLQKTMEGLTKLPDPKLQEASDFVDFLLSKIENRILTEGIQHLVNDSNSFSFLEEEKAIYKISDLKERYK
jgi:hypothetical protein